MADNLEGGTALAPEPALRRRIEELSGEKVSACFQCEKCTSGCPVASAMDLPPNRLLHYLQLGLIEEVLDSDAIWVCASCETCATRCPNEIDLARVMDTLRQLAVRRGVKGSRNQTTIFHEVFLASVRRFGRMHEASLAVIYALKSEGLKGVRRQMGLGLALLAKGKIRLIPGRLRAGRAVRDAFRAAERKGE
jgi:heterodisulfide reductase subunit C2